MVGLAVYCTLLMSDSYLPGAMVLAHSLRDNGAKAKLVVLVTLETLQRSTIDELKTMYDDIVPINRIVNKTPANLYLMDRPDLVSSFTKVELWRQTQYEQIVYIDADVVALRAPNELLRLDTGFAAVPDIGWPDCFNSGVMVLKPNMGDYYSLLALAQRGISFDGADQGLLNMHFRDWERLSFTYNCTPSGNYQYVPAYRHFQSSVNLVHYIGHEKPWVLGRETKHSTGVYDELLGRWWATYDRYYRSSTTSYISGQARATPKNVQQYVHGEKTGAAYGYSSSEPATGELEEPEAPINTTDQPVSDQPELIEAIQQGDLEPTPTVEQRRFSAPRMEWDAAHAPPPVHSKPEASNFPSQIYQMSQDTKLFEPPKSYPEAPKDMYYQVPAAPRTPSKPPPIFPWEQHAPKPTRVFLQEQPQQPEPEPPLITPTATTEDTRTIGDSPETPTIQITATDPWQTYNRSNAWDEMPEIERYVQAFQQARKGKVQVLVNTAAQGQDVLSTGAAPEVRRPSMKLTDFPTEIERPSLPVTPAPVRRPSFWGEERDALGELPPAEGVPKQQDWNPVARLEELQRRQSEVLEKGPQLSQREIPTRKMPESDSAAAAAAASDARSSGTRAPAPSFAQPSFGGPSSSSVAVEEDRTEDVAPGEVETAA